MYNNLCGYLEAKGNLYYLLIKTIIFDYNKHTDVIAWVAVKFWINTTSDALEMR